MRKVARYAGVREAKDLNASPFFPGETGNIALRLSGPGRIHAGMTDYHTAKYWNRQAKLFRRRVPGDYCEPLYLASLVLTNPITWWTRRALRKAVRVLIVQNSQACFVQIASNDYVNYQRSWHGLLHDKKIMQCFRTYLPPEQFAALKKRAKRGP